MSTLYWVTSAGVYHNSNTAPSKIFSLNGLNPTGLALDRATDNIYVSGLEDDVIGHERSVIKVISIKSMAKSVDVVTTQTDITDVAIDSGRGLLFWCEYLRPRTGRIIRSTLDGASTLWLYKISKIVHPIALVLDPIQSRVYWADFALQSISSCDYNGQRQKLEVKDTNGQPLSITFFESRISWTNVAGLSAIHSQMIDSNITTTQALIHHEHISHIITTHSVLEPELKNPCASASCGNGLCLLRDADSTTCMCPEHEKVLSSSPTLICSDSSQADSTIKVDEMKENVADEIVMSNPSVISLSLILVCIAILIILATIGGLYCKRWRRTTSPPPKLRFRNASASVSEEGSTAWEEAAAIEANDRRSIVVQDKEVITSLFYSSIIKMCNLLFYRLLVDDLTTTSAVLSLNLLTLSKRQKYKKKVYFRL